MPVTAPADRRFRRKQVSPRRRSLRAPWRRVAAALGGLMLAAAGLYGVGVLALSSDWLAVKTITVSGNERMSAGEVRALLGGLPGSNLLSVDIEEWRDNLRASPWVADVAMRREFPDKVAVDLVEHHAMAIGRINGVLYLLDENGDVIEEFGSHYADLDLPILDGLAVGTGGRFLVDPERAALASSLFAALRSHAELAARISQIDVRNAGGVELVLDGDTAVVRIGSEKFAERLQSYIELVPRLRERIPEIDYVDLRHDGQVVVRPLPARPARGAERKG